MVALTHRAGLARDETRRLREETHRLRLLVQRNLGLTRTKRSDGLAATARAVRLSRLQASPWSELVWLSEDDEVESALVAVD